jgi:ribosome-binding factor A
MRSRPKVKVNGLLMSKYRIERINETIKEVLSEIVLKDIKDPRLGLVTIVSVRVARDLATARIHFSVLGDDAQRETSLKILRGASGFMRHAIAGAIDVQHAPELRWVYDDSLDRSFRINEVLRETGTPSSTGEAAVRKPAEDDENEEDEA